MTLTDLQRMLEIMHAVDIGLEVSDFVVGEAVRRQLPGAQEGLPEQLFVRDEADFVDLALFVNPQILKTVETRSPRKHLDHGNFEPFCIALEGVSHFVTVAWRAQQEWPVSGLELEVQAEVDKFVAAWFLLAEQGVCLRQGASFLTRKIFGGASIRDEVPAGERSRYESANVIAGRFCRSISRLRPRTALKQTRRFFRSGISQKAAS